MQLKSSRGVQQHDVDAAADALLAEGLRPTVERVRVKIGRGSPNTVGPMLEAWFGGLAMRLGVIAPDRKGVTAVPPAVEQAALDIWKQALNLATEQTQGILASEATALSGEREALAAARRDVDGQLAAASQREALLQASLADIRLQNDERATELRDARALLLQRDEALAETRNSLALLVQQHDAAARTHAKAIEGVTKDRERQEERAAARERRLLEDVDRARQESKAAHKALVDAEKRAAKERAELERANHVLGKALQELRVQHARLQERLTNSDVRVRRAKASVPAVTKASARPRKRVEPT